MTLGKLLSLQYSIASSKTSSNSETSLKKGKFNLSLSSLFFLKTDKMSYQMFLYIAFGEKNFRAKVFLFNTHDRS